jgi:hypothetical protein
MNAIRKGQIERGSASRFPRQAQVSFENIVKGDVLEQRKFVNSLFGIAA